MRVLFIALLFATPALGQGYQTRTIRFEAPAAAPTDDGPVLVLALTKDGQELLGDTVIPSGELGNRLSANARLKTSHTIGLLVANEVPYSRVLEILDVLHGAGIERVMLLKGPSKGTRPK